MKMKKVLAIAIAMVMVLAAFTGCGNGGNGGAGGAGGNGGDAGNVYTPINVIIAHTDTSSRSTHIWSEWLAEHLEEVAPGRFNVEVFPDGLLGDSPTLYAGVLLGTVNVAFEMSTVLAAQVGTDEASVIELPFLYPSYEDWIEGMLNRGGLDLWNQSLNEVGYHVIDLFYNGMRQVISRDGIYRTSADLAGTRVRIPQNELNIMMWQYMGANPTPMAWGEVVTSLNLGTIDALDHSLGVFADFNLYEIAPFLTLTNHSSSPFPVTVSYEWLQAMPADMRAIFEDGVRQMAAQQRAHERQIEADHLARFEAAGVEIVALTPAETEAFIEAVQPVWNEWRNRVGDELMDAWLATRP